MRRLILAILLGAGSATGCGVSPETPLSPSPGAAAALAAAPPTGTWRLTTTLTSVAGPPVCFDRRDAVGNRLDRRLDVAADGGIITLLYAARSLAVDHVELLGTLRDDQFEAATSWIGAQRCEDADVAYHFESHVFGTISEDGRSMTASERWTYQLGPDQRVVLWFAWEAER